MTDEKKCDGKCRLDVLRDSHECPYRADPNSSCRCCEKCTQNCAVVGIIMLGRKKL